MTTDHVDRIISQWAKERPDLDASPAAVIGRLHRVANRLTEELVAGYAKFGLGEGEFDILATLRRSGPPYALTAGQLVAATMVTSGAISKRVDRCERQGWVVRTVSDTDARSRLISLTGAGRALIDEAYTAHVANEHRLVALISERDRAVLAAVLRRWGHELGIG
ncbi:MAG TPA: MarR family transcriptional regulator [Marmoricola sp.]